MHSEADTWWAEPEQRRGRRVLPRPALFQLVATLNYQHALLTF